MGPCRECQQWHCICELLRLQKENREQYADIIYEHRQIDKDAAFQRFMAKLTSPSGDQQ